MNSVSMIVTIDPACEADAATLLQMARAFHDEDGHPLDGAGEAAIRKAAQGEPLARAWMLRRDGEPVGYVVVTLGYSVEYGGRDGFIDDLYLRPEARGLGLGRALLEFAVSQAVTLGIGTLHLEAEADNDRAAELYRRAGFEPTGRTLMRRHL